MTAALTTEQFQSATLLLPHLVNGLAIRSRTTTSSGLVNSSPATFNVEGSFIETGLFSPDQWLTITHQPTTPCLTKSPFSPPVTPKAWHLPGPSSRSSRSTDQTSQVSASLATSMTGNTAKPSSTGWATRHHHQSRWPSLRRGLFLEPIQNSLVSSGTHSSMTCSTISNDVQTCNNQVNPLQHKGSGLGISRKTH